MWVLVLFTIAVLGTFRTCQAQLPSQTPSPTPVAEENKCDFASYQRTYDFERDEGIDDVEQDCIDTILSLRRLQFGPPTEWEMFNAVCKGHCRAYMDRARRITDSSDCNCKQLVTPNYLCPLTPSDHLCEYIEVCNDPEVYDVEYCASDACGRFATNEDQWRASRAACGVAAVGLSAATILGMVGAIVWQLLGGVVGR